jgi:hypothetical protein
MLALYTAGRYEGITAGKGVATGFNVVWQESPVAGIGLAHRMTVDSAYLDMYAVGGFVAVLLYSVLLACLGVLGARYYRRSLKGKFVFFMFLLVVGASLGAPVVTANRFAPAFWVLFALLAAGLHVGEIASNKLRQSVRSADTSSGHP